MTTDNTQELDEILQNVRDDAVATQKGWQGSPYEAKQAILDWHNKQILESLDRLEGQATIYKAVTHNEFGVPRTIVVAHAVPESAVEAERNKLKERMMEIDGKKYRLEEAYMIPEKEVETNHGWDYGDEDTYSVDVARRDIDVEKCFVLVEERDDDQL